MEENEIMGRQEVAEMLKISMQKLNKMVLDGAIPFKRLGVKTVRFNRTRIMEWLTENEREGIEIYTKKRR